MGVICKVLLLKSLWLQLDFFVQGTLESQPVLLEEVDFWLRNIVFVELLKLFNASLHLNDYRT